MRNAGIEIGGREGTGVTRTYLKIESDIVVRKAYVGAFGEWWWSLLPLGEGQDEGA